MLQERHNTLIYTIKYYIDFAPERLKVNIMNKIRTKKIAPEINKPAKFDGIVRVYEQGSMKDYLERLMRLENKVFELEERLNQLEELLLLDRS